jgi:hypothetical protein
MLAIMHLKNFSKQKNSRKIAKIIAAIFILPLFLPTFIFAADNNFITSVDVMKYTKDTMQNQLQDSEISAIVADIMNNLKPQYIAISVPLDESEDYPADTKPAPRTAIAYAQKWADVIHSAGAKVLFRGTFAGIEGIYNFPKLVGSNRFPAGTAATAATDGRNSWLGKIYTYITSHSSLFAPGDIWAILPERTEGIFQDQTSFLSYASPGIQTNYANFFIDLNKVSATAFEKIGKSVRSGYSTNNFSEIGSGWLLPSLFATEPVISVDHYGITHTPAEMDSDIRTAYKNYGKQIFLQEWGDYWNVSMSQADRTAYLNSMYAVFAKLEADKILAGFNYWGGWVNNAEGVLTSANGVYNINYRGQILSKFFATVAPTTLSSTPPSSTTTPTTPSTTSFPSATTAPTQNTSTTSGSSSTQSNTSSSSTSTQVSSQPISNPTPVAAPAKTSSSTSKSQTQISLPTSKLGAAIAFATGRQKSAEVSGSDATAANLTVALPADLNNPEANTGDFRIKYGLFSVIAVLAISLAVVGFKLLFGRKTH